MKALPTKNFLWRENKLDSGKELYLSVWSTREGTFQVFRNVSHPLADSVLIVREQPWPLREGNLLW